MADEKKAPKTMDWVKAKSECSIDALFIALQAVLTADAKAADSRSGQDIEFRVGSPAHDVFMVERRVFTSFIQVSVIGFERTKEGIAVSAQDSQKKTAMFVAKPYVDVEGECKFEVDGTPMEAWQVSKKALEAFLFEFGLSAKPQS